jgi:uncharacterized lipoprotein YmbA
MQGAAAVAIALATLATGCSSPPSSFYTLSAAAPAGTTTSRATVAVGPVLVPASVDRPQIVVTTSANQVSIDEFNRWASPLQDNIARVVAEDLAIQLGTPRVVMFPQTLNASFDYRVQIDIRSFESAPGSYAALDAVWTVWRVADGRIETGRTRARETLREPGFDALAAAHSRTLAQLSQEIADTVRALQRP